MKINNPLCDLLNRQANYLNELENILDCGIDYLHEIRNEVDTTIEMLERCIATAKKKRQRT